MAKDWHAELIQAEAAAIAAGNLLRKLQERELTVLSEAGRDIKLAADQEAEALILDTLKPSGLPVLAEEGGAYGGYATGQPAWVVDPLDGTLNFSRGIPVCCSSIALMVGDVPVLGVVHDFNRGETFTGLADGGAWRNGMPVRVSTVAEAERAILATGFPTHRDFDAGALLPVVERFQRFRKTRMLGSAALMLAYLAAGRVDAYHEEDIMLWDVAAGLALVRGAGGYVAMEPSRRHRWGREVHAAANATIWE